MYNVLQSKSGLYYSQFLGQKFGKLLLLELIYDETRKGRARYQYKCKCDCGNIKNICCWYILERGTQSCGCNVHKTKIDYESYIGKKQGKLLIKNVVHRVKENGHNQLCYVCDCDCGTKNKLIPCDQLHHFNYKGCGCSQRNDAIEFHKSNIGKRFGKLTVTDFIYNPNEKSSHFKYQYKCKCDCGNENYIVAAEQILYKNTKRCAECNAKSDTIYNNLIKYCSDTDLQLLDKFTTVEESDYTTPVISNKYKRYHFKCLKCGTIFDKSLSPCSLLVCPKCNSNYVSNSELIISSFLNSLNIDFKKVYIPSIEQYQNNIELDFYIPNYNIAIELNGLLTHCTTTFEYNNYFISNKPTTYHLNKLLSCEAKNIDLLQFWNFEIIQKLKIVKSIILNKLHLTPYIEYARKCTVQEINKQEYDLFMNNNHIQGTTQNESIRLGLFYKPNNLLCSVMSFGYNRFGLSEEYEMFRFATLCNCRVIGAASKLFKHFIREYNPKSIVSYSDRRLFNSGTLYDSLGFKLDHVSNPNYWYFKRYGYDFNIKLFHRSNFQKYKLSKIFENFDNTKTEFENMELNNYFRIYDCGNKVYTWYK